MVRTNASTSTNRTQGCFSTWIKKCNPSGTGGGIITGYVDASNFSVIYFDSDHRLCFLEYVSGSAAHFLRAPNLFRDTSAWMHIAYLIDTTQGTAANRIKLYINGTQITSFHSGGTTQPDQNDTLLIFTQNSSLDLGQDTSGSPHMLNAYLADTLLVDGATVAIGDLGEFDEDSPNIWKPKDISAISVGTNGFRLDYQDSSNLGNAADGGTDLTETNLAATDQMTDTPTNNFATLNPLAWTTGSGITFSEGNLKIANSASDWRPLISTMAVTSGKWYCEVKVTDIGSASKYGIIDVLQYNDNGNLFYNVASGTRAWTYRGFQGKVYNNTNDAGGASYGNSFTTNDIIGIYLDCDNNKVYWAKNGTVQNSGTGISITDGYDYGFVFNIYNSTCEVNFGSPTWSLSSAVADGNGYGSFEYDPSAGTFDSASKDFYALCTKNLAEYG